MEHSPLPDDLARPRRDHVMLIANISAALILLALLATIVAIWVVSRG